MHWKLFATIVAAAVASYLIIRWLRSCLDTPLLAVAAPKREIGFAAMMKNPSSA